MISLRISLRIDDWIDRAKGTAAVLALLTVPITFVVLLWWIWNSVTNTPIYLAMFCVGLAAVAYLAKTSFAHSYLVRKAYRWLHRTTQAFAIQILLHPLASIQVVLSRVNAIRSRFRKRPEVEVIPPEGYARSRSGVDASGTRSSPGGEWLPRDNWMILVAPYVIPLSTVLLWIPSLILFAPLRSAILGIGLGTHLGYVAYHWQRGSSDLRALGKEFCWMFLPAANLFVAAIVFAFAMGGFTGVWNFMVDWITLPWDTCSTVWNWFLPTIPQETAK